MNKIIYLFFVVMYTVSGQTVMTSVEAEALKEKVKKQANSTQTIISDFTQYKHLGFLSNDIITKGILAFKAPDLIKWEYTAPFSYAVLFKNQVLYINDEGKKSNIDISSNKLFKQLNLLIINSVKGDLFDEELFNIEYFNKEPNKEAYFNPKDTKFASYIKAFNITFNKIGDVVEIKMIEPSDDYTRIVFSNKKRNQKLSDAVFNN